jgi:hypothetical protein
LPGTSTIADTIGSRLYFIPVEPQHAVRSASQAMKPPVPVMFVHHCVPPVAADCTTKRSADMARLVTLIVTPAVVGTMVVPMPPEGSFKLKPSIATLLKSAAMPTEPLTQRGMPVVCSSKSIGVMVEPSPLAEVHT